MNAPLSLHEAEARATHRTGLFNGIAAYGLWGLLPLYFKLFPTVGPVEVVAHRVVWSVVFLAVILVTARLFPDFVAALRQPRILGALTVSAVLIAINWLVYIWAIYNAHILAGSLGYFLNPLVNILLGMVFLHERLRRTQLVAVTIAALGVAVLAAGELQTLWISLTLAVSFGLYGLVRKLTPVPAAVGLAVETLVLAPPALAALIWFGMAGTLSFGRDGVETALLIGTGAITSVPLLLFAGAARRLPMITLGLLQYIAPSLQFLAGYFLFDEPLSAARLASFGLIWLALALFVADSLRAMKRAVP
ncbi:MAG: EamA family transporter RarD [Sphingobium sp.]|nr:EamA family transporter RarD [Sphingobium sp.]